MEMRSYTRSGVFLAVFAAAVLTGATVMAAPITLPTGPLVIQYSNNEQFSISNSIASTVGGAGTAPTSEGNWGILQVSNIARGTAQIPLGSDIAGGGAPIFSNTQNGGNQITGIFYGIRNNPVTPAGISGTGGFIDLYWKDVGTANTGLDLVAFDPARRLNQRTYTGYAEPNNPAFIFLAQLAFGPGCDGNPTHHVCTATVPGTINPATGSSDGIAKSYQSVNLAAGGVWASQLDSNFFTLDANGNPLAPAQDVRTDSGFSQNGASGWDGSGDIIGLSSSDPTRADVLQPVPEPGTLGLFGLGMIGIGYLRRRWQK
jgi:PEP-CTERM motif-containing protein